MSILYNLFHLWCKYNLFIDSHNLVSFRKFVIKSAIIKWGMANCLIERLNNTIKILKIMNKLKYLYF